MFHRIDLILDGPICDCEEEHLAWIITTDDDGEVGLRFRCDTCKVELVIPPDRFHGNFVFVREPYPADREPEPVPEGQEEGVEAAAAPKTRPAGSSRLGLLTGGDDG